MQHPNVCNVILSLKIKSPQTKEESSATMPKATRKTMPTKEEHEDIIEIDNGEEHEVEAHKALNPIEARHHVQCLTEAMLKWRLEYRMGRLKMY